MTRWYRARRTQITVIVSNRRRTAADDDAEISVSDWCPLRHRISHSVSARPGAQQGNNRARYPTPARSIGSRWALGHLQPPPLPSHNYTRRLHCDVQQLDEWSRCPAAPLSSACTAPHTHVYRNAANGRRSRVKEQSYHYPHVALKCISD